MALGRLADIEQALTTLTAHACPQRSGALTGISAVPAQVRAYAETVAALDNPAPHICETGFNCGASATTFLEANPRARVTSFDLPLLAWAHRARAYMKKLYGPERLTIVDGSSRTTIAEHARKHPEFRCDLVVVDGDHSYPGAILDIANLLQFAACGAPILLDDVCDAKRCHAHVPPALALTTGFKNGSNHPAVVGPTMAWVEAQRVGYVAPERSWFGEALDRGWVRGRHTCAPDGRPVPVQSNYSVRPQPPIFWPDKWNPRVTQAVAGDWRSAAKLWGQPLSMPPPLVMPPRNQEHHQQRRNATHHHAGQHGGGAGRAGAMHAHADTSLQRTIALQ